LSGATSLREIEALTQSHAARLYHVGGKAAKRSTLADANRLRSYQVFSGVFAALLARFSRRAPKFVCEAVRLIDSTHLNLSGLGSQWSRFSASVCGAKAHVVFDPDAGCPIYHAVTPANVNDITAAQEMPIETGATYVFDLGYYDYAWWAKLDEAGCRIVTRFKKNTPLREAQEMIVPEGCDALSDRIGFLPARQAKSRKNPMQAPVREVRIQTQTGQILRILSNDLDASAQEIADLYKRRWQIELFFRWVKQVLRIKHFVGRSENAVRIQIAVALIVYLLMHIAHGMAQTKPGILGFARLLRANILHRKDFTRLSEIQHRPQQILNQLSLNLGYT
jgi:hypothetical protein